MLKFAKPNVSNAPWHSRYAISLFILLTIAACAISIATYRRLVVSEMQQTQETLARVADIQATGVAAWVKERIGDAKVHGDAGLLNDMMNAWIKSGEANETQSKTRIAERLELIKKVYGYRQAAIVDMRRNYWISTDNTVSPVNVIVLPTLKRALDTGNIQISPIYLLTESSESDRVVDIVTPLRAGNQPDTPTEFALILRANADFYLAPYVKSLPLLGTSADVLLAEIRGDQVVTLSDSGTASRFHYLDVLPITSRHFESEAQTRGSHFTLVDDEGTAMLSVARKINDVPWYLVTLIDQNAISAHLDRLAWIVGGIGAAFLSLIGIVLLFWWRKAESDLRLQNYQTATEKKLLQQQYNVLSKYANDMIILTDANGSIVDINDKSLQVFQRKRQDLLGTSLKDLFVPTCNDVLNETFNKLQHQAAAVFELSQKKPDGSTRAVEASARALDLDKQRFIQLICRDITERKKGEEALKRSEEKLHSMLEAILDIVWSFSPKLTQVNFINHSVERILGYSVAECMADMQVLFNAIHHEDRDLIVGSLLDLNKEHPISEHEFRMLRKDGELVWMNCRSHLVLDEHGTPLRIDGVTSDITARKKVEQQVQELAYYDNVTGLPNRALLNDRLAQAIQMAMRSRKKVAVLYMDLDNFKNVNDSLGHHVGDMLLRSIGERLLQCVRSEDTVARIGGDEFLVVLPDIDESEQASAVAEKILAATARPFHLQGQQVHTSTSVGISVHPDDGLDAPQLIRYADSALYQAKSQGRNNYQFFTRELNEQIIRSLMIERQLRHAIESHELALWYQPQINVSDGRLVGAEALLRWRRSGRDFLSPVEFIPVAEERGLIETIGEWALREACRQCRAWQTQGLRPIPIAVNVSPMQFQQKNFAGMVKDILRDSQLDPTYLELEITESSIMRRAPLVAELAMRLRDTGVGISIDDFGTGYSSLSYLRQIPIDKIKIDRSFISDMMNDVDSESITYAIINLAHSLNLRVIAEGVESKSQVDRLLAFGCNEVQGNYYSSAVSPEAFRTLLAEDSVFATS